MSNEQAYVGTAFFGAIRFGVSGKPAAMAA
jgi:hypothetical protein